MASRIAYVQQAEAPIALVGGASFWGCRNDAATSGILKMRHHRFELPINTSKRLARTGFAGVQNYNSLLRRDLCHPLLPSILPNPILLKCLVRFRLRSWGKKYHRPPIERPCPARNKMKTSLALTVVAN